jgi:rhomboid protease GluP
MFKRQTTGSVVCTSCGSLVGVRDERCMNCGRRNPGLWGFAPLLRSLGNDLGFVTLVVWGCGTLYVISLLLSGNAIGMGGGLLGILAPNPNITILLGASGGYPVFVLGRWWTVLSAGWLHGSLLHIVFNMMWARDLGPVIADVFGAGRMVIIYTVAGACGFLLSSVASVYLPPLPLLRGGAQLTLGASASIFGLLGALVYYGRLTGSSLMRGQAIRYAVILGVFGLIMPGIDNFAHLGGFFGGYLAALSLDARRPERIDHIVIALICLAAVALSVAASVVIPLMMLMTLSQ